MSDQRWKPSSKQTEFLSATEFEVLYGGAAGGGKTDGLVVDAMGLGHTYKGEHLPCIKHPKYRALLLRRTFPELKEVIDRGLTMFRSIDPKCEWKEYKKHFEFGSGARIELGYIGNESDKLQYQSREFQYVGWEELTQHPTLAPYEYLLSRIRGPAELPKFSRATCNPGGPGHEAVKEYWRIPDEGTATLFNIEIVDPESGRRITRVRRFIPARLGDNPHLGFEYKANLLMMSDQNQKALLRGRWDIYEVDGSILAPQLLKAFEQGRIGEYPVRGGVPINTFWDIGRSVTSIAYHQRNGAWDDWVDYDELTLAQLEDAAKVVKGKDYLYGKHYLPHDAEHTDWSATEDRKAMLEKMGVKPIVIVPRIPEIATGIELLRRAFPTYRFNKATTEVLLKCLRNYKFERDELRQVFKPTPSKDWASHASDAVRQHAQAYKPDSGWEGALGENTPAAQQRQRDKATGFARQGHSKLRGDTAWRV